MPIKQTNSENQEMSKAWKEKKKKKKTGKFYD